MATLTILVVDDDEDVRTMLCVILGAEGYAAVGAADGVEALERMHEHLPALILVDLMMPRMSGEDLIQAMTDDRFLAGVPIAVLSGQKSVRTATLTPRVVARLVKPVELDELLGIVQQCVLPPQVGS